jgi:hypothetical protein
MWAFYADSHRGICFEFSKSLWPYNASFVSYEAPTVADHHNIGVSHVFRKNPDWGFESEVRALMAPPAENPRSAFDPRMLTGITLGKDISPRLEKWVQRLIARRSHGVAVYRAIYEPSALRLRREQVG